MNIIKITTPEWVNLWLSPAYGRSYGSGDAGRIQALDDWNQGKDFIILPGQIMGTGKYCSIRDSEMLYDLGFRLIDITNDFTSAAVICKVPLLYQQAQKVAAQR